MATAYCLIRSDPVYRRGAFERGLRSCGFSLSQSVRIDKVGQEDVLVIWNRYGQMHVLAERFERLGGRVVVAENAYVGLDRKDRRRYALALGGHNGSGTWRVGDGRRWQSLGLKIEPYKLGGEHILVCPNRSFGMPGFIMPPNWAEEAAARLRKATTRPVRIRPHPGNGEPKKPLEEDLRGAWACVIWASSAGCEALLRGIPVFSEAPFWILRGAAERDIRTINSPEYLERLWCFESLAWAQWDLGEIESGEAFQHLLHRA